MKFKKGDKIILVKESPYWSLKRGDICIVENVESIDGREMVHIRHSANRLSWWPASSWDKFVENKEGYEENISLWDSVAE